MFQSFSVLWRNSKVVGQLDDFELSSLSLCGTPSPPSRSLQKSYCFVLHLDSGMKVSDIRPLRHTLIGMRLLLQDRRPHVFASQGTNSDDV